MYLHLRWYNIDVQPYRLRPINVSLPLKDVENLKGVKRDYGIPYGEFFCRAIFYVRADLWKRYNGWIDNENCEERLSKSRGYIIREQLDGKVEKALQGSKFDPGIRFDRIEPGRRCRVCFRMKAADLKLLGCLSKGEMHLDECLHYLIRRTIKIYPKKQGEDSRWVKRLIVAYKPHWQITFSVREMDCRNMDEFIERYEKKYSEKVTRSEIVALAYHLFKRMRLSHQEEAKIRERREGKERGRGKKISVSFSYEGKLHWKKHNPPLGSLRAALHSVLGSNKFWGLVGLNSPRKRVPYKLAMGKKALCPGSYQKLICCLSILIRSPSLIL